jgi:hypothetical protein
MTIAASWQIEGERLQSETGSRLNGNLSEK